MTSHDPRPPSDWRLLGRLLALGWNYRAGCLRMIAQQMGRVTLGMMGLGLIGLGVDVIRHHLEPATVTPRWPFGWNPPSSWSCLTQVWFVAGGMLAVAVLNAWLRHKAELNAAELIERIVVDLRSAVYAKLQQLSFRFYDRNETGSIINRVGGDVQAVRMFVDGVIVQCICTALSLFVFIAYMLSIHIGLTVACLATTPCLWWLAVKFSRSVRPQYYQNRTLIDRMILLLSETVQGVTVVKGFGREAEQISRFDKASRDVCEQKHRIFWQLSLFQPTMAFLTNINLVVLLGYGGYLIMTHQLRLGEGLFVFAGLLNRFADQVDQIVNITNRIQNSLTGAQRVFEVLDTKAEVQSAENARPLVRARGELRFENVSFAYDPARPILQNINLTIPAGSCVALVGATGAGKTALLNLIPRLYDVSGGKILLDGVDLREWDLSDLRRNIGLVFQESFLFSNSVSSNIAFGDPTADSAKVVEAARIAAAHDFVSDLPRGYDTVIGEYGAGLSGGQKQRLAIARALLHAPPILLLDDATAAIDPETENEILQAMEQAMQGRTTVVVAHRLSTLQRADFIVVLNEGRIAQVGTHLELMLLGGHYREAAELQMHLAEESHAFEKGAAA
ncbi:MAG: ABC transporter ATP-binding protein [Planctomycetales bacterium]